MNLFFIFGAVVFSVIVFGFVLVKRTNKQLEKLRYENARSLKLLSQKENKLISLKKINSSPLILR